MKPIDPDHMSHYIAACAAAHLSVATVASSFRSAQDARDLIAEVAKRSIPDAVRFLHARFSTK